MGREGSSFFDRFLTFLPPTPHTQDIDGKTAWELAADSPAVLDLLSDPQKAYTF